MPKHAIGWVVAAAMAMVLGGAGGVEAAEVKVLAANVMQPVLQQLAPAFEKASGNKLKIQYETAGKVSDAVAADQDYDVVILTKPLADKLVGQAKLVGGTAATLGKTPLGLAVKKGAKRPDISSVDAVKSTLAAAKSIAYTDPATGGATGAVIVQMLDKLGIAAEVKPKTKLGVATNGKRQSDLVAKGQAEIAIGQIAFMMPTKGIDIVGPLPAELQSPTLTFVAASPMSSEKPLPAKALIDFLGKPEAKQVLKANGMEPS